MQHVLRHSVFQGQLRLRVHHNRILKTFPEKICSDRAASRRSSLSPSLTPRSSVVTSYQAVLAGKPEEQTAEDLGMQFPNCRDDGTEGEAALS